MWPTHGPRVRPRWIRPLELGLMRRMAGGGKPGVRDQEPEFVSEDASGGTGSKRPDSGTFGTEVNHREELRGFLSHSL